jgi:dTDP-4-amino-4,6-dideoxygalactose transaminase
MNARSPPNAELAIRGGSPVRATHWPRFDKGDVDIGTSELDAIKRVIERKLLFRYDGRSIQDTEVGRFEAAICEFLGVKHALAVSSGTAALTVSLMALGIKPGDEVLCSGFAFVADPSSIILAGGRPVLVDADDGLHTDLGDLERKITPNTKAILIVHQRGQAGAIGEILEIAARYSIPVVEDAVPAMGAKIGDRYLGTLGTFGAFSTQSDKSLNTGEGGFLVTNDTALFERAVLLSGAYEGRVKKHCSWELSLREGSLPLFNFRMDELRGAIALAQLQKLPSRLERLRKNYSRVTQFLARYPEVRIRDSCVPEATLGHYVMFRLADSDPADAQWISDALNAEGIEARCFGNLGSRPNSRSYWNWEFLFPGLSQADVRKLLPATTRLLDLTVDIPLSPSLQDADLNDLEAALAKVLNARRVNLGNRKDAAE